MTATPAPASVRPSTRPPGWPDVPALGTTLCVWAHPDDETYLAGGLVAALRESGRRVVVVTATVGEAGLRGPAPLASDRGLPPGPDRPPPSRADELAAALLWLGGAEHHQLPFPDGACADVDPAVGAATVARVVTAVRPDTVVTFGADGFTGHPDHRAVSAWVDGALATTSSTARLLHPVATLGDRAAGRDVDERFGVFALGEPRVCREEELALRLELTGERLRRKVAALQAHRSQTRPLVELIGIDRYARWVATESFAEPVPSAHPGGAS